MTFSPQPDTFSRHPRCTLTLARCTLTLGGLNTMTRVACWYGSRISWSCCSDLALKSCPLLEPTGPGLAEATSGDIALVITGDGPLHQEDQWGSTYRRPRCHGLWRENDLQPWRQGTFKISKDPRFEEKVRDVVGLYPMPLSLI